MNSGPSKSFNVNLNVGDQLTSISCGHIVVELIKFIAYQRLQIPYTYQWLKQIINKKKLRDDQGRHKNSLQSERYFRTASSALYNLDSILKSLLQEISGPSMPEEVCITLGATPLTCKEVYRLVLPSLCHKPQCHSIHILQDQKLQSSVFRTLVTSDALNQAFSNQLPPTNMHIFLKKKVQNVQTDTVVNTDNFVPASGNRIPRNSQVISIDFQNSNTNNVSCCNQFEIYGDAVSFDFVNLQISNNGNDEFSEIQSSDSVKWYQSTYVMKGFKDCVVNGTSVTNQWTESL